MTGGFHPTDLSIHLMGASSGQQVYNGGPAGAIFPGWFLTVRQNEGYDGVSGPVQIATDDVSIVATMLDDMLEERGHKRAVEAAVLRCDRAMHDRISQQLEAARKVAARIPALEAALAAHVKGDGR